MTKLLIVRHGEASASWEESTDPGLSDLGIVQAEECANMLIKLEGIENFDLKSSPLRRAIETGTKLKEKLNKDLFVDPVFTEIPSPGIPLNKRQQWLKEIFNKNINELEKPQLNWRESIISRIKEIKNPTIIFSHFMVINTIVANAENYRSMVSFYPDNCSVTEFDINQKKIELVNLGTQLSTHIN